MSADHERRPLEATAARQALSQEPGHSTAAAAALVDDLDAVLDGYEALLTLWAYTVVATLDTAAVAEAVTLLCLHLPERAEIDARAVLADVWRSERARVGCHARRAA